MKDSTFCPFPFESLALKSWLNGQIHKVYPCCNMKHDQPITELNNDTDLQKVFNGQTFQNLRKDLINGKKNSLCNYCWNLEEQTGQSPRTIACESNNTTYKKTKKLKIKKLDILTDESCNLRCRMCTPSSSNSLRIDVNNLISTNKPLVSNWPKHSVNYAKLDPKGTNAFFNMGQKYIDEIIQISDTLEEIKFTGGEPTISPTFWQIIDNIQNPNVKIHLTTNGTKFNQRLLKTLDKFTNKHFTISVDGTDSTYEYIRHPFTWDKLSQNINRLISHQQNQNTEIHFCSVLTSYNILNIHYLVSYIEKLSSTVSNDIKWKCIPDPHPKDSVFDVKYLPTHILKKSLDYFEILEKECTNTSIHAVRKIKNYLQFNIKNPIDIDTKIKKLKILKQDIDLLDYSRNQSYKDFLHNDLIDVIKEI